MRILSSRIENSFKNFAGSFSNVFISKILTFVIRTVFIKTIGVDYLGADGLFSNVLGLLSFAELGIGSAVSFALYKPFAQDNKKLISQITEFYKKACRIIALIVAAIGLALVPFLGKIAKGSENIENITAIYLLFLLDSVSSYLIAYKTVLLTADQKNFKLVNINTLFLFIVSAFQIISLVVFRSYILYLSVKIFILIIEKIYLYFYVEKFYPFIKKKPEEKLPKAEENIIFQKVKGLIFHKVGEIAIFQTDSVITSSIIGLTSVGLVSNFALIIKTVTDFINTLISSVTASLGNLIATENAENRYEVFRKYEFLTAWIYGLCTVCLYFLLTPFIEIWLGSDKLVDNATVSLLCINFYMLGNRLAAGNMKIAAGVFDIDKWAPIVEAVLNIIISVIGAYKLGLKGVYIGTVISCIVPSITHPYYLYKISFEKKPYDYFGRYAARVFLTLGCVALLSLIFRALPPMNMYLLFIVKAVLCLCVPNIIYFAVWHRTAEFRYFKSFAIGLIRNNPLGERKGAK